MTRKEKLLKMCELNLNLSHAQSKLCLALIEENEKLREAITNYINQNDCECGNDEGLVCFLHEGIQSSPLDELLDRNEHDETYNEAMRGEEWGDND